MTTPHQSLRKLLLSRIAVQARELPEPMDFFCGAGRFPTAIPENIIHFNRRDPLVLLNTQRRYHHHRWVLVLAIKGNGSIRVDDRTSFLKSGELAIIFPFQYHSYTDLDKTINWLFLTFDMSSEANLVRYADPYKLGEFELQLLTECLSSWQQRETQHLCPLHLGLLLQRLATGAAQRGTPPRLSDSSTLLAKINEIILTRLDESLGLKEIAKEAGLSESHLRARFREASGISLGKHLRDLKLEKACRLLYYSEMSISEIADSCGFQNVFSFSRAFKKAFSRSPKLYRSDHHSMI